jgi:DNA-binding MarR family transcriptional regulator
MTAPQPSTAAGLLLAGQQIARAVETRIGSDKLSAMEAVLLSRLASDGPLTMNAVRTALGIEKSTATSLVDRLQRRGLVERRPHPVDGRSLVVHLTRTGKNLARKVNSALQAVDGDLQVSDSALRGHRQVLAKLAGI